MTTIVHQELEDSVRDALMSMLNVPLFMRVILQKGNSFIWGPSVPVTMDAGGTFLFDDYVIPDGTVAVRGEVRRCSDHVLICWESFYVGDQ